MIIIKLKEAMQKHRRRIQEKFTYEDLAALTGMAAGTLQSIATRRKYHPTLANVERICRALDVPLLEMIEMIDDPPKTKRKRKSKAKMKKS